MSERKDENGFDKDDESIYEEIRLDDELYAQQIDLHPEYEEFLAQSTGLDEVILDEEGNEVNPHLHLTTHVVLEKQMRFNNPPFVRKTVERLEARGMDPHDARHAVMGVLVELMWEVMTQQKAFDDRRYEKRLEEL